MPPTVGGRRNASAIERYYPEAVPVALGRLDDHLRDGCFAAAMSATRVTAPAPDPASGASGGAGAGDSTDDADSTDSDDGGLPVYQCLSCDENVILGGGGILECESCRTRRVYSIGDNVALLALRSSRLNHRQGRVVCVRGERYGVLLVGAADPGAVRPLNL